MIEPLFFEINDRGVGDVVRAHAHPFWQLDMVLEGCVRARTGSDRFVCRRGEALLIPPGARHSVLCEGAGRSMIVKFRGPASGAARFLPDGGAVRGCIEVLRSVLGPGPAVPAGRGGRQVALAVELLLLEAGIPEAGTDGDPGPSRRSAAEQLEAMVAAAQGRYLSVGAIAARLGMSASHLRRRFRDERGRSLKQYLDETRAETARSLLLYSELSIGEIAVQLEFAELSSFSRFVRRRFGRSPRQLRTEVTAARASAAP